mgnify:CR=1 FL=1
MTKDVSLIIICRNCVDNIESAIQSAISAGPDEIIVVDGNSTDGTLDVIAKYANQVKLVTDPGKGVAMARQVGADSASSEWLFYLGCDNTIEPDSIEKLKEYMIAHDWVLGGMLTRIKDTSRYLAFCNNERWKTKITEGPKSVVGTPFMIKTDLLKQFRYNTVRKFSDDTDLCERLIESGHQIGYSDVICYEMTANSYAELKARFKMYGISDAEVYNAHRNEWSKQRKRQSRLHPYRSEFKVIMKGVKGFWTKVKVFPYAFLITWIRYRSWFKNRNIHRQ